jgi:hypothetical protein
MTPLPFYQVSSQYKWLRLHHHLPTTSVTIGRPDFFVMHFALVFDPRVAHSVVWLVSL